ncbi:ABC transporter ATP-binding protein [Clostridium chrysemydis]|uniref:ABC transporter ATP-binding protein n=1 Tax=Clostridium chrysemydis TaxID=2665504 RepID=UPI00188365AB|nr:ABC transporter ATP-binding protein [Clostridium chrysemydis]
MNILIEGVCKSFDNINVLNNINLKIDEGEVFALVGPNGSGKTTLIRILLNIYNKDSGKVFIDDIDIGDKKNEYIKTKIGFLLDNIGLFKDLTAIENLEFFHRIYNKNYNPEKRKKELEKLIDLVSLSENKNKKINFFSRGMKQRLCIARALVNNPELIILDEPLRGLDLEGKFAVREIIEKLSKENRTIFINSHNLDEVERIASKIAFIKDGSILEFGSTQKIIEKYSKNRYKLKLTAPEKYEEMTKYKNDISVLKNGDLIEIEINNKELDLYEIIDKEDIVYCDKIKSSLEDIYKEVMSNV